MRKKRILDIILAIIGAAAAVMAPVIIEWICLLILGRC